MNKNINKIKLKELFNNKQKKNKKLKKKIIDYDDNYEKAVLNQEKLKEQLTKIKIGREITVN